MASKSRPARRHGAGGEAKTPGPRSEEAGRQVSPETSRETGASQLRKVRVPGGREGPGEARRETGSEAAREEAGREEARAPPTETIAIPLRGDGRRHLLSLSFLRDGDEFLARLETDAGQITELKNRALDQLLTLVASELEDLLE